MVKPLEENKKSILYCGVVYLDGIKVILLNNTPSKDSV